MLNKYLSRCKNAVCFPPDVEGQHLLPENICPRGNIHIKPWTQNEKLFDPKNYDWEKIKQIWHQHWRQKNCDEKIFVEKSPPNVTRVRQLYENFPDAYFILSVRNIYATTEGFHRRWPVHRIEDCARHFAKCIKLQLSNLSLLSASGRVMFCQYESLCNRPNKIKNLIISKIPLLTDLSFDENIVCHTLYNKNHKTKLQNFNDEQIARLSSSQIKTINQIIQEEKIDNIMQWLGYENII